MIDDIGKWYLMVSPRPNSDMLEKRRKSIATLSAHLSKRSNLDAIPAAVEGVAWRFARESTFLATMIEAIKGDDLSFAGTSNALELRLAAGLALGELIGKPTTDTQAAVACSTLLLSALGIPRLETSRARKIAEFMETLRESARRLLEIQAANARRITSSSSSSKADIRARFDEIQKAVDAVPAQDAKQTWGAISPHLKALLEGHHARLSELENSARIEREELNVVWWTYSACSSTTGDSYSRMKPGMAALCSGRELADLVLLPPPSNAAAFIADVLSHHAQGTRRASAVTLASVVEDWHLETLRQSSPTVDGGETQYPGVFPLSWIARRLIESEMSADWKKELEVRVGVNPEYAMPLVEWAQQAMWEKAAQRLVKR